MKIHLLHLKRYQEIELFQGLEPKVRAAKCTLNKDISLLHKIQVLQRDFILDENKWGGVKDRIAVFENEIFNLQEKDFELCISRVYFFDVIVSVFS